MNICAIGSIEKIDIDEEPSVNVAVTEEMAEILSVLPNLRA